MDHPDHVVHTSTTDQHSAKTIEHRHLHGRCRGEVGTDTDDVRSGHHDLADQSVAKGDHRPDQLMFLDLDRVRLQGPIGDGQKFLLRDLWFATATRSGSQALGQ